MADIQHVWRVTLFGAHGEIVGTRTYVGAENDAVAKTRRTRVDAYDARVERIAAIDNGRRVRFALDEIKSFSISIA